MEGINDIKQFILNECRDRDFDWSIHIRFAAKHAKELAKKLGADQDVCETAAWLHDIAKIRGEKVDHGPKGAAIAEDLLKSLGYEDEFIRKVCGCIKKHSARKHLPETIEEKIVASADSMAHFDHPLTLIDYYLRVRQLPIPEMKAKLLKNYRGKWNKMMLEARGIFREKYGHIVVFLEDSL